MHRRRPGHHHDPGGGLMEIRRAAVIGAGVMGSGIAAHIANAGVPVDLLDVPAKEGPRDAIAAGAIERLLKTDPAPLMSRDNARLIAITHFFNPPRYLRLLEIVAPSSDHSEAIQTLAEFADRRLGKSVVWC